MCMQGFVIYKIVLFFYHYHYFWGVINHYYKLSLLRLYFICSVGIQNVQYVSTFEHFYNIPFLYYYP